MKKNILLFLLFCIISNAVTSQTILNRGDIAILGVNVAVNKTTQDEIIFVCFKNITSGTEIQITDNGYANCSDSTWTSAEGGVKMKRVGGTIPAGTVLTLRTGNTSGDVVKFTYPDSSWSMSDLATGVTAAKFNLEATGDNFFIAQDGVWTPDPIYGCFVPNGGTKPIAAFPGSKGRIITGFNSTQWASLQSSLGASGAYPELNCFSIAPTTGNALFYKYNGLLTAANQADWLVRINNPSNWKSYTTSALYYAGTPKIDSSSLPILSGGEIPDPSWIAPTAPICSGGGLIDLSTFVTGTKGGTWSGTQVVNGKFNPAGLNGKYAITYSLPFSSSKGSCPLTMTDTVLVTSTISPTVNAAIISPDQYLQSGKVDYKFYCVGTKVTFSASATETGSAPTYQWYRNDTIISGASNKTYTDSILTSATYQCKVTSNSACASGVTVINPRLIIGLNRSTSASLSNVGSNCSGFDTLKLRGVNNLESIVWKNANDVVKHVDYTLTPVLFANKTVAGGNGYGPKANQLYQPWGVALDKDEAVYVGDFWNNRVQRWNSNATSGTTVAGGNSNGDAANQVQPTAVFVDKDYTVYICDSWANERVQKWVKGATEGLTIAGGHSWGSDASVVLSPKGIFVDSIGNVYVSDAEKHRVQKWAPGAAEGITVAGGNGAGGAANQLNKPMGITVDDSGYVYVADYNNNRVVKWAPGATSGTTAVGSGVLNQPTSICLDKQKTLYIAENEKQRVFKLLKGDTSITIVGWTQANSSLYGLAVNEKGTNVYVSDGASSVYKMEQKSSIDSIYVPTTSGNYYALLTDDNGCTTKTKTITVIQSGLPNVTITTSANAVCAHSSVTLKASATNIGVSTSYQWYKNGVEISSAKDSIFIVDTVKNVDSFYCKVSVKTSCASPLVATSNKLSINVIKPKSNNVSIKGCDSITFKGITYTSNTILQDTLKSVGGCDSVYNTVNITLNKLTIKTIASSISGCNSLVFNGKTYNNSTTIIDTIRSVGFGCDSIYNTVTITIIKLTTKIYNRSANGCNSVVYKGITYTASAVLRDTIRSASGCDSIINVDRITVYNTTATTSTTNVNGCGSVTYKSVVYTASTVLSDTIRTSVGCDSIFNVTNISVTPGPTRDTFATTCGNYYWNNINYTRDTVVTRSVANTVSATLTEGFSGTTTATAPTGWTFSSSLTTYQTAGNFGAASPSLKFAATNDQITTPTLSSAATQLSFWLKNQGATGSSLKIEGYNGSSWVTVNTLTTFPSTGTSIQYNATSTPQLPNGLNSFRFTYTKSAGNVALDDISIVYSGNAGCDSVIVLHLTTKKATTSTTLKTINSGDSYTFNGITYTQSGTYVAHLTNSVGCDSAATLILTTTLPVSLNNFIGTASNNNILLKWQTSTEINNSHFIVQHSINGNSFTDIGSVNAIGSGANGYQFTDNNPTNGINYYRLKSIEKGGSFTYSKIVSAKLSTIDSRLSTISVFPNPAKSSVTINGNHIASVQVFDNMGRVLKVVSFKDASNPTLSLSEMATGIYNLRVKFIDGNFRRVGFVIN